MAEVNIRPETEADQKQKLAKYRARKKRRDQRREAKREARCHLVTEETALKSRQNSFLDGIMRLKPIPRPPVTPEHRCLIDQMGTLPERAEKFLAWGFRPRFYISKLEPNGFIVWERDRPTSS